jgi:hypothetical protein
LHFSTNSCSTELIEIIFVTAGVIANFKITYDPGFVVVALAVKKLGWDGTGLC